MLPNDDVALGGVGASVAPDEIRRTAALPKQTMEERGLNDVKTARSGGKHRRS